MPPSTGAGRVLIIEDHEPTRFLRRRVLRDAGFRVSEAGTVLEALSMLAEQEFDLVLSDIGLPDGTGYTLCRRVLEQQARLPIILISGTYDDDAARQTAVFSGAVEFIADPAAPDELIAAVRRHIA